MWKLPLFAWCAQPEAIRRQRIQSTDLLNDPQLLQQLARALPPRAAVAFEELIAALKVWA